MSQQFIQTFLREHGIEPHKFPLSRHPGTPKALLGMIAALAKQPEAIVFSTAGLDPLGAEAVKGIVAAHLHECTGVYLAWPYHCQGKEYFPDFPVAHVVTVRAASNGLASQPQLYG